MKTINNLIYIKYSETEAIHRLSYYKEVWKLLARLVFEYPGFKHWYNHLFNIDFTLKQEREIIMCCHNSSVVGIAILKNSAEEKKICTLRVASAYKSNGIGKTLIKKSFDVLETEKPLLTVHKSKEREFEKLFKYFDFRLEQSAFGYYKLFSAESVYNGYLPIKNNILTQMALDDIKELFLEAVHNGTASYNYFLNLCIDVFVKPINIIC